MIEKYGVMGRVLNSLNYLLLTLLALVCVMPFWIMVVASLTDDLVLRKDGYLPWSNAWSFEAYRWVLSGNEVRIGYTVTILITFIGTLGSVLVMSGLAYVMSIKRLKSRNKISFFVFFTMIFIPGIVPWFVTTRNILHLHDNMLALILPMMVHPFWIFVLRNFFSAIPNEIMESAYIDGASDLTIFIKIVLPLSKPVLATVGLFIAVAYWNDWFNAVMLLDFAQIRPLSVIILRMVNNAQAINDAMQQPGVSVLPNTLPTLAIRMATAVVTIGPIILVYPFVQRFFVRGLTMGSVKG
jgi:putative aldouronate transport system permease protein